MAIRYLWGDGVCNTCKSTKCKDEDFTDDLSRKEHKISKMCQKCQDAFFRDEDGG